MIFTVFTLRRPTDEKMSKKKHMCTIVIKTFPQKPAIPLPINMEDLHNPNGISQSTCVSVTCCPGSMHTLSKSFASTIYICLRGQSLNFSILKTKEEDYIFTNMPCPKIHEIMCGKENLYLLEMKELPLKSLENFRSALNWITESRLKYYMKKHAVFTPGDWPAQFYIRQAVYRSLYPGGGRAKPTDYTITDVDHDHDHYTTHILQSTGHTPGTFWTAEMQSIVPLMGPLHISLNAREDICEIYHPLMKHIYEQLFPGCQLAKKAKPWRTALLLEIIYDGWTLI